MRKIKAKRIVRMAEKLEQIKKERAGLLMQLRKLNADEEFYSKVLRTRIGEDFQFDGEKYVKCVTFHQHEREILDQAKVRKLLGKKTPYKTVVVNSVRVDFLYE